MQYLDTKLTYNMIKELWLCFAYFLNSIQKHPPYAVGHAVPRH